MKKYKLTYSNLMIVLVYLTTAVCIAAFGLNVWRCIENGGFTDFYASLKYLIIGFIMLFAPVLLLSVVYNSYYTVENGEFITVFGFIKSRFSLANVTELVYDTKKHKLTVYSGEEYMLFRLEEKWAKEYIDEMMKGNKRILYDELDDSPLPEKKDKDEKK